MLHVDRIIESRLGTNHLHRAEERLLSLLLLNVFNHSLIKILAVDLVFSVQLKLFFVHTG